MTTRDDFEPASPEFDRLMTGWFEVEARVREPIDLIDRTTARTRAVRPRPAWLLPERWIPMELTMRRVRTPRFTRYAALVVVVALSAAIALVVVGSERRVPPPFGPARNGLLTYATPSGDIVTIDPVTGVVTTVVGGPDKDRAPVFSRDGTRLAFIREVTGGDEIYAVDASGDKLVRLTERPVATVPAVIWSADASKVAFVSLDRLWVAKADGSGAKRIDIAGVTGIVDMAWRPPNGDTLILAAVQDGKDRLFTIKPDGTDLERIGRSDAEDFEWLTASLDGSRVAYGVYPAKEIHVVTIDTGLDQVVRPADGIGLNFPRFSPDGKRLAVLQVPDGDVPTTHIGVFSTDDLTPHLTLLEPAFKGGVQFEWSPDGTGILANQWETNEVWLLDPAGGPGTKTDLHVAFDWVEWQRLAR